MSWLCKVAWAGLAIAGLRVLWMAAQKLAA